MSKGLENLEVVLENCGTIAQSLAEMSLLGDEKKALLDSADRLSGLKDKFFMNTVAAIPATKACLTGTEEALSAVETCRDNQEDAAVSALKNALAGFLDKAEDLLDRAEMRGTTLT